MASGRPQNWTNVNRQHSSIQNPSFMNFAYGSSNIPAGGYTPPTGGGGPVSDPSGPPPLPPRPNVSQANRIPMYRTNPTFNSYNLYGANNYGSNPYMPYPSGIGMNYGYNSYGSSSNGMNYNSLYNQVEDSSRQAFQSIESIVQAFTSVSMMLDSTFQALYSSFRAVVGVADNLTKLKSQICHMVSALAIIRTLRYLVRKVLEILRLSPPGQADAAWSEAVGDLVSVSKNSSQFSSWPIIMFFGIIIGAPWLIWKLIAPSVPKWLSDEEDHYVSESLHNFQAENPDELSFSAGQKIMIAPKEFQPRIKGWLLASVDGKKVGIVPVNYLKMPIRRSGRMDTQTPDQSTCNTVPEAATSVNPDTQSETHMDNVFNSCSKSNSDT